MIKQNAPSPANPGLPDSLWPIFLIFLRLGCTAFGGPIAHLGYLRREFVEKRRWLSEDRFAGIVSLCQFLPGPASSQVVFAIGNIRAGLLAGLVASAAFLLPSAVLMIGFGMSLSTVAVTQVDIKWLIDALKLVAVPFVAQAVYGMFRSLCPDAHRRILCVIIGAINLFFPTTLVQILSILVASGWGVIWSSWGVASTFSLTETNNKPDRNRDLIAAALLIVFFLLLMVSLASYDRGNAWLNSFNIFYGSGALVFGGGHVVLPLLRSQLVPSGLISDDLFLSGYGAAQALPGPLFAFAGFIGSIVFANSFPLLGGLWCLAAIFLPAWLIIGGALPFWDRLSASQKTRASVAGANVAVVGVLLAAFVNPVCFESLHASLHQPRDIAFAIPAFIALEKGKVPPIAVVATLVGISWLIH